jgi:hypothetical protein
MTANANLTINGVVPPVMRGRFRLGQSIATLTPQRMSEMSFAHCLSEGGLSRLAGHGALSSAAMAGRVGAKNP